MNDSYTWDAVAIDTSVFEHILNPERNSSSHINETLRLLQKINSKLLVDSNNIIFKEYLNRLGHILNNVERMDEISVLRYWLVIQETREKVAVDERGELMNVIKSIVHEPDAKTDRTLVCVAFLRGKNLISNDETHIVIGPEPEWGQIERRHRLKKSTKKICQPSRQSEIMTSIEAHARVTTDLKNQENLDSPPLR